MRDATPDQLRRVERRQPMANLIIVIVSLLLLFPLTVVTLRMYVRIRIAKNVRMDDFFMILATVFSIGVTVAIAYESKLGVASRAGLKAGVSFHLLYFTAVWALKMSVCCFCHNIFGRVISPRQNFLIWGSMGIVTAIYVTSFGTLIFSCSPISSLWNLRKLIREDGCVNVTTEQLALAVINAVTDWLIMYLPVVLIKQSTLNSREKQYISGILSLAFLAVLASIGRVVSYAIVGGGVRTSAGNIWILLPIFTSFELNLAIAASSLPSLSPLIRGAVRRFKPSCSAPEPQSPDLKPIVTGELGEYDLGSFEDGTGIKVEMEYWVERSSPRLPMQAHSPRRMGGGNPARMEARGAVMQGRRLSFMEMLRQGPPPLAEERRGKAGEVLGV